MPALSKLVLANWGAAMALWALPYLSLLHHFRIEASATMQWSLLAVCAAGSASALHIAFRASRRPSWRASHGLRRLS